MRLFRKFSLLLLCGGLAASAVAGKKEEPAPGKKGEKKEKGGKAAATPEPTPGQPGRLSLPLVPGHDSYGLKIPYYDDAGRLQMNFIIDVATKTDADHVKMSGMKVETFNEEGESEMMMDLPVSTLDLNTRVISSQTKTTISREDFTLTGDGVEFDTVTKQGSLVGHVRMIIYNVQDLEAEPAPADHEAPAEATPKLSPP